MPILHKQIVDMFHSAWPQSIATIEDEATTEAYCLCNWYWDQCDNLARRAKNTKEIFSSKRTQHGKNEGDLEASKAKEAALETEVKELCKELKLKGKCKVC